MNADEKQIDRIIRIEQKTSDTSCLWFLVLDLIGVYRRLSAFIGGYIGPSLFLI